MAIKDAEYDSMTFDFENTYANLTPGPGNALNGQLLVIGDSFAFLLAQSSGYDLNYIVHQGYCLESINENLIKEIPDNTFKYAFLFIGPNDFMNQTDVTFFQNSLIEIINKLKAKGMRVALTSYLEPDFTSEECKYVIQTMPVLLYDQLIKGVAILTGSLYFDIRDLYMKYGLIEGDYIHPSRAMYKPVMERLLDTIKKDLL